MILKTSRLVLRPMKAGDARPLFAIFGDAAAMAFWDRPPLPRLATMEAQLADELAAMRRGDFLYWTVCKAGEIVGSIDLSHMDGASASTGFAFRSDQWGQGLGREAMMAVRDHAFAGLGLSRLAASIQTANRRARHLLEGLGFQEDGALSDIVRDGARRSRVLYVLHRSASPNGA